MAITINGTTGIAGVDGSASTPAVQGTDTNTGIFFPAADTIAFGEGGAEVMRIDSDGDVGIGTTTPGKKLDILSNTSQDGIRISGSSNPRLTIIDTTTPVQFDALCTDTEVVLRSDTNHPMVLSTNGTERARITSAGDFLVGTTSASAKVDIVQAANSVGLEVNATDASYSSSVIDLQASRNTTNNSYYFFSATISGIQTKIRIADSGNVTNVNGTYGTISDLKLKQDITDATPQWDDIKNLRFRKYRLKSEVELDPNAKPFLGLVAQEAELVCPGLVEEHTDRDREDNDLGTTTKSIKTSILYMKAVKALQEAMARIETLEAQNAAFETRLAALEAK